MTSPLHPEEGRAASPRIPHPSEDKGLRPDLTTLAGQKQHYSAVRARLAARPYRAPRGLPMVFMVQSKPAPDAAVEPETISPNGVPLNMLTMPSWRFLVALAAVRHGVGTREILGKSHSRQFMRARHEAMALTYEHTQNSYPQVGALFGRDHSTVLYGMNKLGRTQKLVDRFISHPGGNPLARERRGERLLRAKLGWEG